jgi:hypothetical protein
MRSKTSRQHSYDIKILLQQSTLCCTALRQTELPYRNHPVMGSRWTVAFGFHMGARARRANDVRTQSHIETKLRPKNVIVFCLKIFFLFFFFFAAARKLENPIRSSLYVVRIRGGKSVRSNVHSQRKLTATVRRFRLVRGDRTTVH